MVQLPCIPAVHQVLEKSESALVLERALEKRREERRKEKEEEDKVGNDDHNGDRLDPLSLFASPRYDALSLAEDEVGE